MNDRWLDLETLALLQHQPPEKLAPAKLPDYSVVMLQSGADRTRMIRALRRINGCTPGEANAILDGRLPRVVNADLPYPLAGLAQFELVCCDAVSVILPSELLVEADAAYLQDLFAKLRQSDEFQPVVLRIESLPPGEGAARFLDQFLGTGEVRGVDCQPPIELHMFFKKARIMTHWAKKISAKTGIVSSHPGDLTLEDSEA